MPDPFFAGVGGFFCDGAGKIDGAEVVLQVFLVDKFYVLNVKMEGLVQALREDGEAVIFSFSVTDNNLAVVKVDVFNAQAHGFHDSQSAAVHNLSNQFGCSGEAVNEAFYFIFRKDSWDAFCALWAVGGEDGFVEWDVEKVTI